MKKAFLTILFSSLLISVMSQTIEYTDSVTYQLYLEENWSDLKNVCELSVKNKEYNLNILKRLGYSHFMLGNAGKSRLIYAQVLKQKNDDPDALIMLHYLSVVLFDYDKVSYFNSIAPDKSIFGKDISEPTKLRYVGFESGPGISNNISTNSGQMLTGNGSNYGISRLSGNQFWAMGTAGIGFKKGYSLELGVQGFTSAFTEDQQALQQVLKGTFPDTAENGQPYPRNIYEFIKKGISVSGPSIQGQIYSKVNLTATSTTRVSFFAHLIGYSGKSVNTINREVRYQAQPIDPQPSMRKDYFFSDSIISGMEVALGGFVTQDFGNFEAGGGLTLLGLSGATNFQIDGKLKVFPIRNRNNWLLIQPAFIIKNQDSNLKIDISAGYRFSRIFSSELNAGFGNAKGSQTSEGLLVFNQADNIKLRYGFSLSTDLSKKVMFTLRYQGRNQESILYTFDKDLNESQTPSGFNMNWITLGILYHL
jgi:hypothetical protein